MRQISIGIDVFARIWSLRSIGEDSEDQILRRILKIDQARELSLGKLGDSMASKVIKTAQSRTLDRKIRWIDDVQKALVNLNREAHLKEIYTEVEYLRKKGNRTLPRSADAIIRRTLEENSSDSDSFKGEDIFYMTRGKWSGYWAIR